MILIQIFLICPILGQEIKKEGRFVKMDLGSYSKIREKVYLCDTIIMQKDSIIDLQYSIIDKKDLQLESLKMLIISKDTTIKQLREIKLSETKKEFISKKEVIFGLIGLLLGILVMK